MLGYLMSRVRPLAWRPDEDCSLDRGRQLNQFFGDLLPRRVLRSTKRGEAS
jgi:hypothetical protein